MTEHRFTTVECSCATCATNAATLGVSLPMRAEITEAFAAMLGRDRKAIHNVVETANHPGMRGGNPLVRAING